MSYSQYLPHELWSKLLKEGLYTDYIEGSMRGVDEGGY